MPMASVSVSPSSFSVTLLLVSTLALLSCSAEARATSRPLTKRNFDPLNVDTPSPEDSPPISVNALRDPVYLPAQIGGIVGAYALSLVLVAITLLCLSKSRRRHLKAAEEEAEFTEPKGIVRLQSLGPPEGPSSPVRATAPNFSYPSPQRVGFEYESVPYIYPSSGSSSVVLPGVNPSVDQGVVAADHAMAQQQLEDMYKHVMEHEEAKQRGVVLDQPSYASAHSRQSTMEKAAPSVLSKKEKSKPSNLNLSSAKDDRSSGSKTASFLSALRSPKKKAVRGANISSPIMTPQSSTFPREHDSSSFGAISPRHYIPPPPPPVPADSLSIGATMTRGSATQQPTPDQSPESVQSIDERIGAQLDTQQQTVGRAYQPEPDPESAVSEHSQVPLVGLPQSPKPGATFPSLPSSPKPGASFSRPNPPSAVRTGGALPLRAYEPAVTSPSALNHTTKQTVFERQGPLSPATARTPGTSVPYSPYQPYTPCMPVTPSLVTREDRKRMKKVTPKTPTMEMVKSSEDIW